MTKYYSSTEREQIMAEIDRAKSELVKKYPDATIYLEGK